MSAGEWVAIEPQYVRLRAFYGAALAAVAVATVSTSARSGLNTSMKQVKTNLDRLGPSGDLGTGLAAGRVSLERWVSVANAQGNALSQVMATIGEENVVGRFWSEVIVPTVADLGTTIKEGATGAGIGFGAVVALALLLWVTSR